MQTSSGQEHPLLPQFPAISRLACISPHAPIKQSEPDSDIFLGRLPFVHPLPNRNNEPSHIVRYRRLAQTAPPARLSEFPVSLGFLVSSPPPALVFSRKRCRSSHLKQIGLPRYSIHLAQHFLPTHHSFKAFVQSAFLLLGTGKSGRQHRHCC